MKKSLITLLIMLISSASYSQDTIYIGGYMVKGKNGKELEYSCNSHVRAAKESAGQIVVKLIGSKEVLSQRNGEMVNEYKKRITGSVEMITLNENTDTYWGLCQIESNYTFR